MMRNRLFLILCITGLRLWSQSPVQPTVDKLQARYKAIPSASVAIVNGVPEMQVMPEITITLRADAGAARIYFKMSDAHNNAVVYEVNYLLGSAPVTNDQGLQLFYRDGSLVHIAAPSPVPLMPYKYEVYTEDSQGHASPHFLITQ